MHAVELFLKTANWGSFFFFFYLATWPSYKGRSNYYVSHESHYQMCCVLCRVLAHSEFDSNEEEAKMVMSQWGKTFFDQLSGLILHHHLE